jgi:hypothetical protein
VSEELEYEWTNPLQLVHEHVTALAGGGTETTRKTVEAGKYRLKVSDLTQSAQQLEDFGQVVSWAYTQPQEDEQILVAPWGVLEVDARTTGKLTDVITSVGSGAQDLERTRRVERSSSLPGSSSGGTQGGTHGGFSEHTETWHLLPDWATSDTYVAEADDAGALTLEHTIGGTFGETLWRGTEGRHVYDEWLYDSYVQGTAREIRTGEYDSSGFVWTDTARSSTVTGQYDPDGKLLSASGSLRQQIESGGMFWAEDHEDATRTFGDWEAIRGYERTSSDRFRSSLARDWTPPTRPLPSSPRPLPCLSACPHASPRFCGKSPATGEPQVQVPTTSKLPVSPASRLRDSDRCLTPGGTTAICFSAAYLRWHCISTKCNRSPAPNIGRSQPASL